jgi:hypothetical protein
VWRSTRRFECRRTYRALGGDPESYRRAVAFHVPDPPIGAIQVQVDLHGASLLGRPPDLRPRCRWRLRRQSDRSGRSLSPRRAQQWRTTAGASSASVK